MKRTSYLLSILFLLVLTLFTSCKDDDAPETEEDRKRRQLTSAPFTVNTVTIDSEEDTSFEGPTTITFQNSNTFSISGNTALPDARSTSEPLPSSGEWAFTDQQNFNTIALTADGATVDLTIITLSDSELVFSYTGAGTKAEDEVQVTVSASR